MPGGAVTARAPMQLADRGREEQPLAAAARPRLRARISLKVLSRYVVRKVRVKNSRISGRRSSSARNCARGIR